MFNAALLKYSLLAVVASSAVTAFPLAKRDSTGSAAVPEPSGWRSDILESYTDYHLRYLALDCADKHSTPFFDECCHPMVKSDSLSNKPSYCTPSKAALSSASTVNATPAPVKPVENVAPAPPAAPTVAPAPTTKAAPPPAKTSAPPSPPPAAKPADPPKAPSPSTSEVTGGSATYFYQNGVAGACGKVHPDSALIAAIDIERYGNTGVQSSLCGKQVVITNTKNNKSVTVTIADACPTCNNGNSIDLSFAAFTAIAPQADGIVPISWHFA